jgi:hypothetical protein
MRGFRDKDPGVFGTKTLDSTCSLCLLEGPCGAASMLVTVGLVCSKNEIVSTDGAKLLVQFSNPTTHGLVNREKIKHKSLPEGSGGR